jgi:hypothetical protein
LASKNQVGIEELSALKFTVQALIPFGDSWQFHAVILFQIEI